MDLVWRILPSVRPRERERFLFFLALGAALALAQTVGATAAESLFLSRVGAAALPATFVLASGVATAASFAYAIRVGIARNDAVLEELVALAALLAAAIGVASWLRAPFSAVALYCFQLASQAILLGHFSELAGDCFDRLALKRVTPLFAAGLSVGASAGGAVAVGLSTWLPSEALVAAWSLLLAAILLWLRRARTRIGRWSPLGLEEDARSVEGARAAARYLGSTPLGRTLVVSSVLMIGTATVSRFLYSTTIASAFPDENALAAFLGSWLAITNLAQVVLPLWIVPALIARLGVPSANLIHPVLSFGFSMGLAVSQQLPVALGARLNGELLENALAGPVRNLVSEAMPERLGTRASAFLGGVVVQAALSLAGGALLLASGLSASALALVGAALALAYLLGHLRLRRTYLASLVEELAAGRLDLAALGSELGRGEVSRLAALWEGLREAKDERSVRMRVELAPFLAARGVDAPLLEGVRHGHPRVRAACLDALAQRAKERPLPEPLLLEALEDEDPDVRLAAVRALPDEAAADAVLGPALRERERDTTAAVAASAAARFGAAGLPLLRTMLHDEDPVRAVAALEVSPAALGSEVARRMDDPDHRVRAAVIEWTLRHPGATGVPAPRLVHALQDADVRVRAAAARALGAVDDPVARAGLAQALGDPASEVRERAVSVLAVQGAAGEAIARTRLAPTEPRLAREAALAVLVRTGSRDARALVVSELRRSVRTAWEALAALRVIPEGGPAPLRWLRAAEDDALAGGQHVAFRALSLLEDATVARTVERTLRYGPERLRFEALEVLSHLGEREAAAKLVLLLEPIGVEEKIAQQGSFVHPPHDVDEAIAAAREGGTRWLREAAQAALETGTDPSKEDLMERLLFLRGVALFSNLSLDQLEAVERITREELFVAGERIVREGDPGETLYLVMAGELSVWRGFDGPSPQRLNTLGPGSYLGEMSIFDQKPRSATVVSDSSARVLALDGARLHELVLEQPEIAFEIFRELTARVRAAEARLPG